MYEFLSSCLAELNIILPREKIDKLINYMQLVLDANKLYNLTSITEQREFIVKHITDSLSIAKYIPDDNLKFIDIGSGAGFPGIPIRIVKDKIDLTMIDSTKKKTDFISKAISELDIGENIHIKCARAEELAHSDFFRERYDIASARAVAPLAVLVELCVPFVCPGGIFIAMKGKDIQDADSAIKKMGAVIENTSTFTLPFSDYERNIIIIKKINHTEQTYPRKYSAIKKQPL